MQNTQFSGASRNEVVQMDETAYWTTVRNARIAMELGVTELTEEQISQYIKKQHNGAPW